MQSAPIAPEADRDSFDDEITVDAEVAGPDPLVDDELLIEEISIDGMCGVY